MATNIDDVKTRRKFEQNGWRLTFTAANERRLLALRDYIQRSKGEFTVAKDQYVRLNTGWFSDRQRMLSRCRPPSYHTGNRLHQKLRRQRGTLVIFRTVDEVADAVKRINADTRNTLAPLAMSRAKSSKLKACSSRFSTGPESKESARENYRH